ncbi:hypothetical protein [Enterovirga sp.]|uniref:hypothetical protein n=1 Tax=Enterovirga sp. TaxID=2026350 RepID=UPI002B628BE6|nr:hypothetical protein [Enterovirga sp.]HMO30975.1 hypothetical protein [Enterovirga sp.]
MQIATVPELETLLARLKSEQHALIDGAACQDAPIHRADLRSVAELENAIAAVIALIEERRTPRRSK